jgi:DNA replication protein DnaC
MLHQPTRDKLTALKLHGMLRAWDLQAANPDVAAMPFDDRLGLLADAEVVEQSSRRLASRLRHAQLRQSATMEDVHWRTARGLDRSFIMGLADCDWIRRHQNILITGATGTGKSYLACALSHAACRTGLTVRYWRLPRLWDDLYLARLENRWGRMLATLARYEVLTLDDWGLSTLSDQQRQDLLEILDDRDGRRSTIIVSQVPLADWHAVINEPTTADAILDRLVHNAHKINLKGDSMRKTTAKNHSMTTTNS